jgi:perosamine synthetase
MADLPAIAGGSPVRSSLLPYAHQCISDADIEEVTRVLRSDYLTTGPEVAAFERDFATFTGAADAVAVSNGTTALHLAVIAAGIGPGDEVLVPAMTFAATSNAVLMQGGMPVFVDVDSATLLIDPKDAERKITAKTKAIIAVDYAGQPCDYAALRSLTAKHHLTLIADACHALGSSSTGKNVGTLADLSTFSFHPVKPLAAGEGGMVTTDDAEKAQRMRRLRNHGMSTTATEREKQGAWSYSIDELGYNYRLSDVLCALGRSQLKRVPAWTKRRQALAKRYDEAFAGMDALRPLAVRSGASHAYHLYVVELHTEVLTADRTEIFKALRAEGIGVNVHYVLPHLQPFYRTRLGTRPGMCPIAEAAYERILSLPLFASMRDEDAADVIEAVRKVCAYYHR